VAASSLAQEGTQQLFASLRHACRKRATGLPAMPAGRRSLAAGPPHAPLTAAPPVDRPGRIDDDLARMKEKLDLMKCNALDNRSASCSALADAVGLVDFGAGTADRGSWSGSYHVHRPDASAGCVITTTPTAISTSMSNAPRKAR
jgi:hypothetical protein